MYISVFDCPRVNVVTTAQLVDTLWLVVGMLRSCTRTCTWNTLVHVHVQYRYIIMPVGSRLQVATG